MARNPNWTRDELILALDLYFRVNPSHTSDKNPEIIQLSDLLNELPIHPRESIDEKFRNPNGVYMKLCNFLRLDPSYPGEGLKAGSKLEEEVWEEFSSDKEKLNEIANLIKKNFPLIPNMNVEQLKLDEDEEFSEGKILTKLHKSRERNSKAVQKKKILVLEKENALRCEICGFDFNEVYGDLGFGFAECHHTKPVSQLQSNESVKISDLSILCANCHRMIHRTKPMFTIFEMKDYLSTRLS